MMRKKRVGLMLWPAPGLGAGFERGVWAESAGFDDVWMADAEGLQDPVTLGAALGTATTHLRICTGVIPVFNRPPAVLATGVIAAEQRAAGRFVLGLGASSVNMIDRWYGLPFEKPVLRVRETVALLREIFAGRKTEFAGKTIRSHGFRLQEQPTAPIPIYVAAMGARMLELAGEIADGVVLNDFSPTDRLPWALEQIDRGAKRGGRRVEDLEIVRRRGVRVAESAESTAAALEYFRTHLSFYASAPVYQEMLLALGYSRELEEIRAGYATRDRKRIVAAVHDAMVNRVFLSGSADACRASVRADFENGVDTISVSPQATDAQSFEETANAFAASSFRPPAAGF